MGSLSMLCACFPAKRPRRDCAEEGSAEERPSDLFFDLRSLQIATNFFSELNQLGHGGFGPVYKAGLALTFGNQLGTFVHGFRFRPMLLLLLLFASMAWFNILPRFPIEIEGLMPSGQEIAVKKLSLESRQGLREFVNEVKLLLKIQHKNLVMLLGCCAEGPEKMLVYEYLPNKSLDYFLFDKAKSASLDWQRRYQLVAGVSRGLLYLHEEAPQRIIHRDIKASNILLDEHMNPKISDFGLARLFPGEGTHTETLRISGTRGYMAPEYAMRGILSVKTDVFSFGILVLEIVSGRKNHDGRLGGEKEDLLSYTWALFQEGMVLKLVDPTLAKCNPDEATLCIQLGLLCCQASASDRPDMISVHLMLSGDSFTLPRPGKPGVQGRQGRWSATNTYNTSGTKISSTSGTKISATSGSSTEDYSRNSMSISSMGEGR